METEHKDMNWVGKETKESTDLKQITLFALNSIYLNAAIWALKPDSAWFEIKSRWNIKIKK